MTIVRKYYNQTLNEEYDIITARYGDKIVDGTDQEDQTVLILACTVQGAVCVTQADTPDFFNAIISSGIPIGPAVLTS